MKQLILIVDDDDKSRKLAAEFLAVKGFAVVEAGDGEECLVFAAGKQPDLILLDHQMPRLDGIATMKRLKGNPSTAAIPVVMLSASAMEKDKKKMREAGCTVILTKPVNLKELLATVREQLEELSVVGGSACGGKIEDCRRSEVGGRRAVEPAK